MTAAALVVGARSLVLVGDEEAVCRQPFVLVIHGCETQG